MNVTPRKARSSDVAAHPDVVDVAVIARPHETYGESIVAVVTPREGASLTLAELQQFCSDKISRYKIPHDMVVGTIPRNPSGKILKHQLRADVTRNTNGTAKRQERG